jgi:hypothetical protein
MLKKHLRGDDKWPVTLSRCGKVARLGIAWFTRLQKKL